MIENFIKLFLITFDQTGELEYADKHGNDPLSLRLPHDIVHIRENSNKCLISTNTIRVTK